MTTTVNLHYASGERFFATDAAMMADHAPLRAVPPLPGVNLPVGLVGLTPSAHNREFLDWPSRDYAADAKRLMPGYGHVGYIHKKDGWTQLWLFMLYNDKAFLGFGLHEGDWEMVQWHEDGRMVFGQHSYGRRDYWRQSAGQVTGTVQSARGPDRIVWTSNIYIARGSHALYPTAGRYLAPVVPDVADGDGKDVRSQSLPALELREFGPWASWPGRWGSTEARNELESNSPESPLRQRRARDPEWFWRECENLRRKALGSGPYGPLR